MHPPHGHVSSLGRKHPPDQQGAAPVPGVRQAAEGLHPAPPILGQPALSEQGLQLLGTGVVPGPHRLLLKEKADQQGGWGQRKQGAQDGMRRGRAPFV